MAPLPIPGMGAGAPPGLPGAPPPPPGGGGLPPSGTGAAAAPGIMLGNQKQGMAKLEVGLKALQDALGGLPMGSPIHTAVLEALTKIGKHMPQGGGAQDPQAMIQQLAMLAREAKAAPQQQAALAGLMGPGAGAPPMGGGPVPPPPVPE